MSRVTIHLIVRNGEKYIRHCLDSLKAQTFKDFGVIIFDNNSNDQTKAIIENEYPKFRLYKSPENFGAWPAFSRSLSLTNTEYAVFLSVDIILDKNFLKETIEAMDKNQKVGAVQGKIMQWNIDKNGQAIKTDLIDTVGFQIYKSRRLINKGHGEKDIGQYDKPEEIFGVEGACVVFRRKALEQSRLCDYKYNFQNQTFCELSDENYFWYVDDLDLVWRMRIFGWEQYLIPKALLWHDRSTTKGIKKDWIDYFKRLKIRKQIPIHKRRLDWRNMRLTIMKNDFFINILKDLPYVLKREILILGYTILFEPQVLLEIPKLLKLIPEMLQKRKEIMKRAKIKPEEIRKWFK
ncbi:MAG: glycosyltransferase [Parcubacteria group bacterium]|nr:glycosyltransferase [Parcubacteria group bacterium]